MHPTAEDFLEEVKDRHGIEPEIREFPEGTKTAEDAADAIDCELEQIVKSLVFVADGEPVVVLTSGTHRVDEEKLAEFLDASEARTATPDEVKDLTGWSIGGVPPFLHDLEVLKDPVFANYDTVWAAAGTPEAVFPTSSEQLEDLADSEDADVFE